MMFFSVVLVKHHNGARDGLGDGLKEDGAPSNVDLVLSQVG